MITTSGGTTPLATPVAISTTLPPAITAMQQQGIAVFALPATPSRPFERAPLPKSPGAAPAMATPTSATPTAAVDWVEVVCRQLTSHQLLLPTLDLTILHGTDHYWIDSSFRPSHFYRHAFCPSPFTAFIMRTVYIIILPTSVKIYWQRWPAYEESEAEVFMLVCHIAPRAELSVNGYGVNGQLEKQT